ncbi:MAG: hypothetical protein ACD_3C00213G0004 [uncultured bacterium (gcode 4)]|uniref:tRNA-splicing ligase RtcB n=1 Tax=uncultured bacterium (gcode 4) TaxID=1234023 RepID=K2GVN0_9BACT|nr:MAG: hypothetical protein ACD_3C00213G0004 [uncultured bacterium (gcode 4)]
MERNKLLQLSKYLWEFPKDSRFDMRVPARIYASEKMLDDIFKDKSLDQLVNLTTLSWINRYSIVMPDAHEWYGSPIWWVFATRVPDWIISPGAVWYDINCWVRLLLSTCDADEISHKIKGLAQDMQFTVPSWVWKWHKLKISINELNDILRGWVKYLAKKWFATSEDVENCESNWSLPDANPDKISEHAKLRWLDQEWTLGSGNHFLEVQKVEKIFDDRIANIFWIRENQVVIMVHTWSRWLGHQVATDYVRIMLQSQSKYWIELVDRELACLPFSSPEWQDYFAAMSGAANFAWANRQMITYLIRQSWERVIGKWELRLLYDVAHNICKIETHQDEKGHNIELLVHRKWATRSFPPHHVNIPARYMTSWQPVLIPWSMWTSSFILSWWENSSDSFYSACHWAWRSKSRHQAIREYSWRQIIDELRARWIVVECSSMRWIAEEAPWAYKDIEDVIEIVDWAWLAKKVAQLKPIAVIKGE